MEEAMEISHPEDSPHHIDKKRKLNDSQSQPVEPSVPATEPEEDPEDGISYAFPIARIKKLMQNVTDDSIRSSAVHLVCKATELFLFDLALKSYRQTSFNNKRTVRIEDVQFAVSSNANLEFIEESRVVKSKEEDARAKGNVYLCKRNIIGG